VVLSNKTWTDLTRINRWVNDNVKPMTDLEHWGGREVVVSGRRLRRRRGLRAAQAAHADGSRLAARRAAVAATFSESGLPVFSLWLQL
jgi:predicted transglutaminase-like cysteine proteinase